MMRLEASFPKKRPAIFYRNEKSPPYYSRRPFPLFFPFLGSHLPPSDDATPSFPRDSLAFRGHRRPSLSFFLVYFIAPRKLGQEASFLGQYALFSRCFLRSDLSSQGKGLLADDGNLFLQTHSSLLERYTRFFSQ